MLRDRPFLVSLAVTVALTALGVAAVRSAAVPVRLEWVIPFSYAAQFLGGVVVSFLCLEHHRTSGLELWQRSGLAFASAWGAAMAVFVVWPGYLGARPAELVQMDAAFWVRHVRLGLFAVPFVVPTHWLPRGRPQVQGLVAAIAGAVFTLLAALRLDPVTRGGGAGWAVFRYGVGAALLAVYVGMVAEYGWQYLRMRRPVSRYLALALFSAGLVVAGDMLFTRPFVLGWYLTRAAGVMVYVAMLAGLMKEYAALLRTRRELQRTDLILRVADAALASREEEELIARLGEELRSVGYAVRLTGGEQPGAGEAVLASVEREGAERRLLVAHTLPESDGTVDSALLEAAGRVVGLSLARLEAERRSRALVARIEGAFQRERSFTRRLRVLADTGRGIASSLSLSSVEKQVTAALVDLFQAESIFILLSGGGGGRLWMHHYAGPLGTERFHHVSVSPDEGLAGRAFREQAPLRLLETDTARDPVLGELFAAAEGCSSWLLPLVSRGERLGLIGVCVPAAGGEHSEEDRELLEILAQQVAVAVQNARLYEESLERGRGLQATVRSLGDARDELHGVVAVERRRSTQLHILNQLAVTLNSEADVGLMLDEVLAGALRLSGAGGGSLYLNDNGRLRLEAFTTSPELVDGLPPAGVSGIGVKGLAERAVRERRPVRLAREAGDGSGRFQGFLATPLIAADGEPLACLVLSGAPSDHGFTAEDEMLMDTLAAHTAVALQNMRRLRREREVAEYLQRAMLPRVARVEGLEVEYVYESATDATLVGGDFYDVIPLKGGRTAVVVGDVCGKGLQAATQMAGVRHILRGYVALDPRPGEWLALVNTGIATELLPAGFVTVVLAVIDPGARTLEYALAGHPPPLLASPDEVRDLTAAPGLPLGVHSEERYQTHRVGIAPHETLVLYSDGLYEARNGEDLYGAARLPAAARAISAGPLRGAADRLVAEARDFAGGRLADDVVVMLVRLSDAPIPPGRSR